MDRNHGYWQALETWLSSFPSLTTLAASGVVAAAVAFVLKLGRDFVADKRRQAASLRIVAVYIGLAKEGWDNPGFVEDDQAPTGRSIASLPSAMDNIRRPQPEGGNEELYTPFVPFSPQDDLSVAEVRDFLGFLDRHTIGYVVKFIQSEATTHALADDFRSEFVRRQFDQERKIELLKLFSRKVVEAYDDAERALEALEPYMACPPFFWCLPFGYTAWRFLVWLWKEEERRPSGSEGDRGSDDGKSAGSGGMHGPTGS